MRKCVLILVMFAFITTGYSQENKDIKMVIEQFFVHMSAHDSAAIRNLCMPDMILKSVTIRNGENRISETSLQNFMNSVGTKREGTTIEEKILSYDFRTDGPLSVVWTPYEFYVNGKKSHHGTNAFTMVLHNNAWKVLGITDTRYR